MVMQSYAIYQHLTYEPVSLRLNNEQREYAREILAFSNCNGQWHERVLIDPR